MWIIYPTGQNYSLELMFATFATAKIAEKFKPTKTYIKQVLVALKQYCMENDDQV